MTEFKKVAIFVDENKINSLLQPQENRIEYFEQLVNMYDQLNTGEPLQKNDLQQLVANPKEFIAKRLIKDETVSIGGLKLNFEKMFDIIVKPDGTDELINKILDDSNPNVDNKELLINQRNVNYFEIDFDNKVVVSQDYVMKITEQSTVYLTDERQQKAYDILNSIAKEINELNKVTQNSLKFLQENFFENYFNTNNQTETIELNPYFGKLIL